MSMDRIMGQFNSVHTLTPYFFKMDFNIILSFTHFIRDFLLNSICISHFPHALCTLSPLIKYPDNIWRSLETVKLFVM